MKAFRIFACIAVALLLMGILYRPGVRVIVSGNALPGVYSPAMVGRCAANAHAAAEEICRGEAVPGYQLIPVLTPVWSQPQELQLTRILLESYDGVQRVYAIRVNGTQLGQVSRLQDAYLLRMRYPRLAVTVVPTYTCAGEADLQTVMEHLENYGENFVGPF